ncbi:hypothetical protein SS50377_23923 [Spironucleus salmonicida]|uniref:Uncharacterized protein n=1 Tax=Spironucleus salmonicida TaxID=348837 RepID=V6LUL4_9EUKA|nr:hypothetical protein SS50377_23923 [Spironucleus salmonicida]|eukprot:EST48317.1 Hypothetical protein SS50377_11519 [Spironucleus salmonicida]
MLQFPRIEILRAELQLLQPQQLEKNTIINIQTEAKRLYKLIPYIVINNTKLSSVCEYKELKSAFNNSCNEKHLFRNFCQLNYNSDFHFFLIQFIVDNYQYNNEIIALQTVEQFQTHFIVKQQNQVNRKLSFCVIMVFAEILDIKIYDENALLTGNFQPLNLQIPEVISVPPRQEPQILQQQSFSSGQPISQNNLCDDCCQNCSLLNAEILNLKLVQNELRNRLQGEINSLKNIISINQLKGTQAQNAEKAEAQPRSPLPQNTGNEKMKQKVIEFQSEIYSLKAELELHKNQLSESNQKLQEQSQKYTIIEREKAILDTQFQQFKTRTTDQVLKLEGLVNRQNSSLDALKSKPRAGQISEVAQYIINDLEDQLITLKCGK